ncbi:anhydro-N-acetylmuramic acid kinase [Robiginitalea sp. SC105]|uniref:anhydro-N-acetylmuramic acid kinase n=1 Tax=Robiginitalea sp. SC105 TaxID=2762332 RepID=UPI00163A0F75|nr:anhydro-N-acetylmuramic acid kinase [Robiginitalea sp. SC105]MBC2839249.1 anhydro-N-acetylmuramic acid kinase [Robiginitalea sp. SC105]
MKTYRILGMMSGTSLDGLDLVLAELTDTGETWKYRILEADCIDYDAPMRERLHQAIGLGAVDLLAFHTEYGRWLGRAARQFLRTRNTRVDAVASHGHTIHHRPDRGVTFQLGCPQEVALHSGVTCIGDFRSLDVRLGGQGAPLVPIGDRLLFGEFDFCLNLGGISNISFERDGKRTAFDIGIANMLLNHLSREAGHPYDAGGNLARKGRVLPGLLRALDNLPYYHQPFPKSTGYEWFRDAILPLLADAPDSPENRLQTAVRHIAGTIARQIDQLAGGNPGKVLVTGGGAYNAYLMEVLEEATAPGIRLVVPEGGLVENKEALVFALLGALRLQEGVNVLASVTGASRDSCSGVIYLPGG